MYFKIAARLIACCALASVLTFNSIAQTTSASNPDSSGQAQGQTPTGTPPAATPAAAAPQEQNKDENKDAKAGTQGKVAGTSNDRLFYALPNFLTLENGGKVPPLTMKEKYGVVARSTFDPVNFPWWGFLASLSQASNGDPAYGQGLQGYAKRYGSTAGDSIIENFMVGAVFPSVLRQDPRFYQSGKGGFVHRAIYAVTRVAITKGDNGHSQFNFSEVGGAALAAAISAYSYHPKSTYVSTPSDPHMFIGSERTISNSLSTWGTQLSLDTMTFAIKEFWPDIHRAISHKKTAKNPEPAPANPSQP